MFTKPVQNYCRTIIRMTKRYARGSANPGMNKIVKQFEDDKDILQDPTMLDDDIESDFMNVHDMHKHYEREAVQRRDMISKKIIKNKYFKTKQANFLIWAEKEQMRLLHRRDPDEWSAEKLSESFPADIATVEKILKAQWRPQTAKRLEKHDEIVKKNWELFRKGEYTILDKNLVEHLQKFANRYSSDIGDLKSVFVEKYPFPRPSSTEFSNIVNATKDIKQIQATQVTAVEVEPAKKRPTDDDTYMLEIALDKRHMRFEDLKKFGKIQKNEDGPGGSDQKSTESKQQTLSIFNIEKNPTIRNSNNGNLMRSSTDGSDDVIKEKIKIPKKYWKSGATYKVDDCYYHSDGTFLYRVPGMTGT